MSVWRYVKTIMAASASPESGADVAAEIVGDAQSEAEIEMDVAPDESTVDTDSQPAKKSTGVRSGPSRPIEPKGRNACKNTSICYCL